MSRRLRTVPQVLVAALVVNPIPHDRSALRAIFARSKWKWVGVQTIEKASSWLAFSSPPPVVICERDLPDGDWKLLYDQTEALPRPPRFIVSSRLADEHLWAEVLNVGGHDVLATPFDEGEVSRVVQYASESWHRQWENATPRRLAASSGRPAVS